MEIFNKIFVRYRQIKLRKLPILIKHLASWWPSTCDLCLQPAHKYSLLCHVCWRDLGFFKYPQGQANLLRHPQVARFLGGVKFDNLVCVAPYQWPFNQWISQLKYQGRFEVAHLLAELLAEQVIYVLTEQLGEKTGQLITVPAEQASFREIKSLPSLIVPVPIHTFRLKQRLYNQAALIGHHLSKRLGCDYSQDVVTRQVHGKQQVGQSGAQRRKNLRSAFALNAQIMLPEHVGIVDDVVTTGATVNELARLLKHRGVKTITVFSICLTLPKGKLNIL